jgi:hypothetical protein
MLRAVLIVAALSLLSACTTKMPETAGVKNYGWYIPQYVKPEPNFATLEYYLQHELADPAAQQRLSAPASEKPTSLNFNVQSNSFLSNEMQTTGLLSYLYYDDGKIIYDEITSQQRFGKYVTDNTPLSTHSIGKSWTSYLLGQAICRGLIDSVYSRIDDWDLLTGTVYDNQRLIDLINMRSGDQHIVTEADGLVETGRWFNNYMISSFVRLELANTSPTTREYNYNGLATNIVLNYVLLKTNEEIDLLRDVFTQHVKIENPLGFYTRGGMPIALGPVRYSARASRYDFLRVGIAMLDDWHNDPCMNNYFKALLDESKAKGFRSRQHPHKNESALRYGGFFHTHYIGMRNRNILGMDGYGGQSQLIDFDNNRIVSVNTIHTNYDWGELVYRAIKHGDIQKE